MICADTTGFGEADAPGIFSPRHPSKPHQHEITEYGNRHTGKALKTGKQATGNALGRAFRAVGNFLNGEKTSSTASADRPATAEKPNR